MGDEKSVIHSFFKKISSIIKKPCSDSFRPCSSFNYQMHRILGVRLSANYYLNAFVYFPLAVTIYKNRF